MNLDLLDEPFVPDDIEWRAQSSGKGNSGFWVKCLAYVTNRAIMKRLDEVCGKSNWKNEFKSDGTAIECGISIKVNGEWVTKWDAAEETKIESVKGGRSSAMKRAAVQWGIGRYLYELDEGWGNISNNGKNSAKTKQGEWFKWDAPTLPDWALPKKHLDSVTPAIETWIKGAKQAGKSSSDVIESFERQYIIGKDILNIIIETYEGA